MKEVQLGYGKIALIDDEDFEAVSQYRWHAEKHRHTWYAACQYRCGNGKRIYFQMHRLIMGRPLGHIDHRDGDGLNNMRNNLRVCTPTQNTYNRRINKNNTSGYKGVFWHKQRQRWQAGIGVDWRFIYLGLYNNPIDAARAYDDAARLYFGEFAHVNFP